MSAKRVIESRKKVEAKYREMESLMANDKSLYQIAHFENSTSSKIEGRMKQERIDQLTRERAASLVQRKQELAELLESEMEYWKNEVMARVETVEDRKMRIKERAYALRDAREREREEFSNKMYEKQMREASNHARELDSIATTQYFNKERLAQIEEKKARKQRLTSEENAFVEEWKKQLIELEEREKLKQESRKSMEKEMYQDIRTQMDFNLDRRKDNYYRQREEDEKEIQGIREALQTEEEIQRQRQEEARQRGREVFESNISYKKSLEVVRAREQAQDRLLLDHALRNEKSAIERDEAKRLQARDAALQYRRYLEEQCKREVEDTAFIDEVRRREEEKVWKQRDEALQARDDARKQLMRMVDQGRQDQIRARAEAIVKEREESRQFANRFLDEAQQAMEQHRIESQRRREIAIENASKLKDQIAQKQAMQEFERQEAFLQDKHMRLIERMHQQKAMELGGSIKLHHPITQKQTY